jgi:hypothetical protein
MIIQTERRNQKEVQIKNLQSDSDSEIEDLMNPKDELKKKIVTLAGTMRKWNDETIKVRNSARKQFEEIVNLGLHKYNMEKTDLRRLVEGIFRYHGVSNSWIRKLLPIELKDSSKMRISYQQKQEIEKERQRLLLQQEASKPLQESVSYQPSELELIPSTSEIKQDLELECVSEYDPQDHETLSSLSREPSTVQNELNEAYKKIEKLEAEVRRLSEHFIAKAILQAYTETFPLVAHIDPVEKIITRIGFEKGSGI